MSQNSTDWTVLKILEWATSYFEEKGIRNPRLSIEWLLAYVLNKKRLDLYLIYDRPLTRDDLNNLRPLIKRRANHEPLQYITGETNFYGYKIQVMPGVLIPRPETEELVEWVLEKTDENSQISLIDIGTGSGCIPIAVKKERPNWSISAFDVSPDAIDIARQNAELNDAEIEFSVENIFSPGNEILSTQFDVIVSNPPYVLESESETLDKEVKEYEPDLALFTISTEKIYSAIETFASKTLKQNGFLILEINERFGQETLQIFTPSTWETFLQKDYAGKDRFIFAKKLK